MLSKPLNVHLYYTHNTKNEVIWKYVTTVDISTFTYSLVILDKDGTGTSETIAGVKDVSAQTATWTFLSDTLDDVTLNEVDYRAYEIDSSGEPSILFEGKLSISD